MEPSESVRLYAVYLGGDPAPGRLTEDHEVVFVVATDVSSARSAARQKWTGISKAHVDAIKELSIVDGFYIALESSAEAESTAIDMTYEPYLGS